MCFRVMEAPFLPTNAPGRYTSLSSACAGTAPPQHTMEKYLREWRQEALNRCQYDTAIFVADKLLALTGTLLCSTPHTWLSPP